MVMKVKHIVKSGNSILNLSWYDIL